MSTILIIILGALVVVLAALVLVLMRPHIGSRSGGRGGRVLRRRFGPEYERTVAGHGGDQEAAERDLNERLRRYRTLRTKPLPPDARGRYSGQWTTIQEDFVESPARAVGEADVLLSKLVRDRGFPAGEYDEQVAALSVHHPRQVVGYRQVHTTARRAREGQVGTEELRSALLHARELFEVLTTDGHRGRSRGSGSLTDRLHVPRARRGRHTTRRTAS